MIRSTWILVAFVALLVASTLQALVEPQKTPDVAAKAYRHADLDIPAHREAVRELPTVAASQARERLARLGANLASARLDKRSGRFVTLLPEGVPLVPGTANGLHWNELGLKSATPSLAVREKAAANALLGYLEVNQVDLGIDVAELSPDYRMASHGNGDLYQIYIPRQIDGIPVRGSFISATIGQGNLTLLSVNTWGDVQPSNGRRLSAEEATDAAVAYLSPLGVESEWGKPELAYVPLANGQGKNDFARGQGYRYELVWSVKVEVSGDAGSWELFVDQRGSVLKNEDMNAYAEVVGGVLPVSNDGVSPDGVEQAGWPMPFADIGAETTTTGGIFSSTATATTDFYGPYVNINDNCGASSLTGSIYLDWGTSGGTDCTTPGYGGAGNTHASRSGFYELNRIKEMARSHLPGNTWLQGRLTANMNINNTCNAFWNGSTVNFYRSGGGCANTGEIAALFDHEWGHGMDANDVVGGIASPSGEGIADIYSAIRLNDSCIGRNFQPGVNCSGNGDPCLNCTGIRDIDYLKRASGQPHTYAWSNANCGGGIHCVGSVYAEAVWSLWKRKLPSLYRIDSNTAHEITIRLTYIAAGNTSTWFSGDPPNGGCGGSSGYMNFLAADDDNGNLNDGTPHMTAIYQAFNDQEIACNTPAVQDSGCADVPATPPNVSGSAGDKAADLSWNSVAEATSYAVYRAEGVFACDFGKVKLGETTGTSWNDTGLQNGRTYSYVVIPKSGAACFGPASSCTDITPVSDPNLTIDTGSASTLISGGDSDAYLDNCETGTMTFTVNNTGAGTLTNVRITSIVPSNPGITVTTSLPAAISPSSIAQGSSGTGSFSFIVEGLSFGETLTFTVTVDANELSSAKSAGLDEASCETDLPLVPSQTFTFETGTEDWTTVQGTFARSSAGGGANGTTWYEQSSANLDNQCDQIQSPVMVFTSTTTLTLSNNYDIEPIYTNGQWYDRANVGLVVNGGSRSLVSPDGGRLYNATGVNGTCGTAGQDGWADTATTWANSTFSAVALGSAGLAGQEVQLDIRYGTDASLNGYGFRFDEVTVTDVQSLGPDTQSDTCGCTVDADCDNGLWCDGAETCVGGVCQPGTASNCNDDVNCTDDSCNEGTDQCDNVANDANCDDGLFCNGAETCNATLDCQAGSDPCTPYGCDETGDICECNVDADCDDGLWCNGAEACNPGTSMCEVSSGPCPGQGCDEVSDVCTATLGPQNAVYDFGLGAPRCVIAGSSCDSQSLLNGRATLGPEPNQPNTIDTCTDGISGTYHFDESNDRIVVSTLDGSDFAQGATVQVDATVYAWSTGAQDTLDLYYAADASNPTWMYMTSIGPPGGGVQPLSAQYTLPGGCQQVVRANFRYQGSMSYCPTGVYDDQDDLVFAVNATEKPEISCSDNLDNDCDGFIDSTDTDCDCTSTENPCCDDGLDNDGDALTDDADPDCVPCLKTEVFEVSCSDGLDNDCDLDTDGSDPDCVPPPCNCGLYGASCMSDSDCCGGDCRGKPSFKTCRNSSYIEFSCSDGLDNDCDGVIDLADTEDCMGTLQNGVPDTGLTATTGDELYYTMTVPPCATNLVFTTTGTDPDSDLYVKFGNPPTTDDYDCRSWSSSPNETCIFETAQAGTYYVMVHAYSSYTGLTLEGSYNATSLEGSEDFEVDDGNWTTSGTCTTGTFVRGTPGAASDRDVTTQLSGAQSGTYALFTQPNASSAGVDDVDDGECVATSPAYNVTADSILSLWYYHGQRDSGDDPLGDYFYVETSVNGGGTWSPIAFYGDGTVNAAWTQATTAISAGDTVQVRVRVADGLMGEDSSFDDLIEAGVDNLSICRQ